MRWERGVKRSFRDPCRPTPTNWCRLPMPSSLATTMVGSQQRTSTLSAICAWNFNFFHLWLAHLSRSMVLLAVLTEPGFGVANQQVIDAIYVKAGLPIRGTD